jgi:hypothetical protein
LAREPDLLVAIFSDRAPGKFFRFNSSLKRCISLLRLGARSSYPDELELASGRPGPAYAAGAVPPGTRDYRFSENFSTERPGSSTERHVGQNTRKREPRAPGRFG